MIVDLILISALGVAFYVGFRAGAKFNTLKALRAGVAAKFKTWAD